MDLEVTIMGLICNAGEARSLSMEAIKCARVGNIDGAEQFLVQADEAIRQAHLVQTELIGADEGEGKIPVTLVMVHAQDHLMTTIQAIENARETVHLYQRLGKLEQAVANSAELA